MLSILQMDLEIADCGFWSGGVQLPGTVVTADSREIHPLHAVGCLAGWRGGTRKFGHGVDG